MIEPELYTRQKSLKSIATFLIILASLVLFLSGGCTLLFMSAGGLALAIGAIGIVPSILIMMAAFHFRSVGANILSGVIGVLVAMAFFASGGFIILGQFYGFEWVGVLAIGCGILLGWWSYLNFKEKN